MQKAVDKALADISTAVLSVQELASMYREEAQKTLAQEANAKSCVGHLEKAKLNVLAIEEIEETRRKV